MNEIPVLASPATATPYTIRPATEADIPKILPVLEAAKAIMRSDGNLEQWAGDYPAAEHLRTDIGRDGGHVVLDGERIVAYFAFLPGPEPTYARIYDGEWTDDVLPYHVIHRLGSLPEAHGIFRTVLDYGFSRCRNLRIDTHRDNRIMQHNILKYGFRYCGIIFLADGAERLAYQLLKTDDSREVAGP